MTVDRLFPAPGASGVCLDSPLRIAGRELEPPRRVRILRSDGSELERIQPDPDGYGQRSIGGATDDAGQLHLFRYRPIEFSSADGTDLVTISPARRFEPDTRYRIEIDGSDAPPGRDRRTAVWTFRTRKESNRPADRFRVAADGSGDFCTVQGAVDAAAEQPVEQVTVDVAAGHYREICYLGAGRARLRIQGAGRGRTKISYDNNDLLNGQPSDSRHPLRRLGDRDLYNGWRANVGVDRPDVTFADLTLINTTPAHGSQAEAFRGNHDRIVLDRVQLESYQDTLRMQGCCFVTHSLISGAVDVVWGTGAVHHWRNEYRSTDAGYLLQIRNPESERGHVFTDCRFTRTAEVADGSVRLARTDTTAFPHSEVIMIDSEVGPHISDEAWLAQPAEAAGSVRYAEYGSVDPAGRPIDLASRPRYVARLTAAEAQQWRDPASVLGGWTPITVNTDDDSVDPGAPVLVHWSAPPGHSRLDAIRLGDTAARLESSASTGQAVLTAPRMPGRYRLNFLCHGSSAPPVPGAELEVRAP